MTDLLDRPAGAAKRRAPATAASRLRVRGFGPGGWFRKTLFWTHLVVAIASGVIVLVMSVTGVALAYQKQVNARALKAFAAAPPAGAARLSLDDAVARARAAMAGERPMQVTVSADAAMPVAVTFEGRRTVAVNPYTGAAAPVRARMQAFFGTMERLHRSMTLSGSMRNPVGTKLTGAANLGFLFLVLSGLLLWTPRRWSRHAVRAVAVPRWRAEGRARDWNWHHVAGLWFATVLIVIVASGAFMSYRWPTALVAKMAGDPPPPAGGEGGPRPAGAPAGERAGRIERGAARGDVERGSGERRAAAGKRDRTLVSASSGVVVAAKVVAARSGAARPDDAMGRVGRARTGRTAGGAVAGRGAPGAGVEQHLHSSAARRGCAGGVHHLAPRRHPARPAHAAFARRADRRGEGAQALRRQSGEPARALVGAPAAHRRGVRPRGADDRDAGVGGGGAAGLDGVRAGVAADAQLAQAPEADGRRLSGVRSR